MASQTEKDFVERNRNDVIEFNKQMALFFGKPPQKSKTEVQTEARAKKQVRDTSTSINQAIKALKAQTEKPLADKWNNLTKNEKSYTLRWMQKRMGYKDAELLGLNEAALMRAHEYIHKLPSNDRVQGQNRTDLDDHHADAGDLTSFRKTKNTREKFYYYITSGVRPKEQDTGFFSAIADGATLGIQLMAKVGLDAVGLTVDVAEGIAEHGVGFKALEKAQESLEDYDVEAIATDLAVNVATAGAAAVGGKVVKTVASKAVKAAKKVAPQTVEAIEDTGKKLGMKTAKPKQAPQDLARQAKKEKEIADSFEETRQYKSQIDREELEARFKKEMKALESDTLNDPAYQQAMKEYDEALQKLQNDKQFIRESAKRQAEDIERKYTFKKGMRLDKGDVSEKHREAFEFTRMGYETPAQREASLLAEQEQGILSGWKYDANLSTEERAIYVNDKTKKIHINNRGTQTDADWEADKKYLLGVKDKRYKRLIFDYETTHTRYPDYVIEGSGQSLGGAEAQAIIDKYGTQEWLGEHTAINPLTSPLLRARFTSNALMLGDEGEKLAAKMTTIQHSKDLPANLGGVPYGQRIVYDTDVESGESLMELLGNAHRLDTLDNRGTIKSITYVNPNRVRKELTEETIDGLKYEGYKPATAIFEAIAVDDEVPEEQVMVAEIATDDEEDMVASDFTEGGGEAQIEETVMAMPPAETISPDAEIFTDSDTFDYHTHLKDMETLEPQQPMKILGYCIYPVALESKYLNHYVEFG